MPASVRIFSVVRLVSLFLIPLSSQTFAEPPLAPTSLEEVNAEDARWADELERRINQHFNELRHDLGLPAARERAEIFARNLGEGHWQSRDAAALINSGWWERPVAWGAV